MCKINEILNKYNLEALTVDEVHKGSTNDNFIVETQIGKYFLRKYSKPDQSYSRKPRIIRTDETILYEHSVLKYARDKGFFCVPPLENNEGSTVTKDGDDRYALFPYVHMRDFEPPAEEKGIEAAGLLAKYHEMMKDYPVKEQRPNWGYIGRLTEWFDKNQAGLDKLEDILSWLKSLKPDNELFEYLSQSKSSIVDLVNMLSDDFPEDAYQKYPIVVNHGDYMQKNIAVTDENKLILVDFDFCVRELRIYDLALLIAYTAGEEHTGRYIDPAVARNIVDSYRKYSDMSPEELCLMPYMAIAFRLHLFLGTLGIMKKTSEWPIFLVKRNVEGMRWLLMHSRDIKNMLKSF